MTLVVTGIATGIVAGCTSVARPGRGAAPPQVSPIVSAGNASASARADRRHPVLQASLEHWHLRRAVSREAVLAVSGRLDIVGGLGHGDVTTSSVTAVDPTDGASGAAAALARPTHDAGGAFVAGRATVFGGGSVGSGNWIQQRDPAGAWRVVARLPAPRSDLTATTIGSRAYVLGGYDGTRLDSSVLSISRDARVTVVGHLPVPVRYAATAAVGNQIWVIGGRTQTGPTDVIQRFDVATARAAVIGHLGTRLVGASAVVLGGQVYVCGGIVDGVPTADVTRLNPTTGRTTPAGLLPTPVSYAGATVLGGSGYLVGGETPRLSANVIRLRLRLPPAAPTDPPPTSGAAAAPWLSAPAPPGRLRPGSDPNALPTDLLIADKLNNRLIVVDPQGRVRWQFPRPGDLSPGQTFRIPDDAFFSPDGRFIIATQEDQSVITVIDVARHRIVYRYGVPGHPGMTANHLSNPDDAMMLPNGDLFTADIKNCRLLLIAPPNHVPLRVIGTTTHGCLHAPPRRWGSPNGVFPESNGRYLVTEINGSWVDEIGPRGNVYWSTHPAGISYPSDTNQIGRDRYLTVDYSAPGRVMIFNRSGRTLWTFRGHGKDVLNHPSLALPLPNGDVVLNDDYNHRVVVIDPRKNRIVWQYGVTGVAGRRPGYLDNPDGIDLVPPRSFLMNHAAAMRSTMPELVTASR